MYIDDFCLEGAWIVDNHSQVSSYQELIACVLELIDAGYSGWEWYHIQLVVLIEYGEASILGGKEDIIAHFSYPFEGDGSAELRVVDGKRVEMEVKVGDKILYSKYAGTDVKVAGEEYIILRQDDILAIVE